jgi:hypothetical protein
MLINKLVCFLCASQIVAANAFQPIPGQTQNQNIEYENYEVELRKLKEEVEELKKQSSSTTNPRKSEVKPSLKVYDENFDSIKESQEKQQRISEEFSEQLSYIAFQKELGELNSLKEVLFYLPKGATDDSTICNDLKDDIEDLNEIYKKLWPLLQVNIVALHIINYLAFYSNNLILCLIDMPHNVILAKDEAESLLKNAFENISNFLDKEGRNFINTFISTILKQYTQNTVPSYFVFSVVKIICEEIAKLKTKLEEITPEFLRKFKLVSSNINNLIEILKKTKIENVEAFVKIVEHYSDNMQKTNRELEANLKNLALWSQKSSHIWDELNKKRKNDKILGLISRGTASS